MLEFFLDEMWRTISYFLYFVITLCIGWALLKIDERRRRRQPRRLFCRSCKHTWLVEPNAWDDEACPKCHGGDVGRVY